MAGAYDDHQYSGTAHYVREGAGGTADGSDWTNAWPSMPASFVRGDTYYIADGSYGAATFSQADDGVLWINIKKAYIYDHGTETGWDASYGDGKAVFPSVVFSSSYWEMNGNTGSRRTGYGFEIAIETSSVVSASSISHITLRYCNVHQYAEGTTRAQLAAGNQHHLLDFNATTNITFSHLYLHHVKGCQFFFHLNDTVVVEYCWISENCSTAIDHAEGMSDNGSDNVTIRYNKWCDIDGTAFIACINGPANSAATNWDVYGNVFWHTGTFGCGVSAVITVAEDATNFVHAVNWNVFNNTVYMVNGWFHFNFNSSSTSGVVVENNLIYQNRSDNSYTNYGTIGFGADGSYDYNYYGLCAFPYAFSNAAHENTIYDGPNCRLSDAVGFPGFVDAANGDFHLLGPIAGYTGFTLAAPYDHDMDGVQRGSSGAWTRGAYE